MMISASYKTDIPAFYGRWFDNRLNAGYCKTVNPYNNTVHRISLLAEHVDGFVFWTKNLASFLPTLKHVAQQHIPFVIQYSINSYPRFLEKSVVDADRSIKLMHAVAQEYGQKAAVWRYDPIIFCDGLDEAYHRHSFEKLARALAGSTDEVVISFAQIYKKTKHNMESATAEHGFEWFDPEADTKLRLAEDFVQIAQAHDMQLSICSQRQFIVPGAISAACVSDDRLSEVSGRILHAEKRGNRPDCGCSVTRDIGEYDTCPHGCVYCYAVRNRQLAQKRFKQHDPEGEFLFPPDRPVATAADNGGLQMLMFS